MHHRWQKRLTIWAMVFGLGFLAALPVLATQDYRAMTTEELAGLRGTMGDAPPANRDAFRDAWHERLNAMAAEEREQYLASCRGCMAGDAAACRSRTDNRGCFGCRSKGHGCRVANGQEE